MTGEGLPAGALDAVSEAPSEGSGAERGTKSVSESRVELSQLMRPQHGNFAGNVHGGTLLQLMDEVSYTCASRFAERYCVTVAVDEVEFLSAVRVGDVLTLRASVNLAGRSSMDVGISMAAQDPTDPTSLRRTNRCYFTMVALDDDGKPTSVPALRLESPDDFKWHCEAKLRRQLRRQFRADLAAGICHVDGMDPDVS